MSVLARGSVTDRPWGMTLGALGLRRLSGQLTVTASDSKPYRVAFSEGVIVGAESPLASDAAVRLALTNNLITSSQVGDITRRMAAAPDRDEVDLLAEIARLQPDQAIRLRRRLVAHRAARTFSVDPGEFVVEDTITLPVVPGGELDVRTVIFLGAKANLAEERLVGELEQLGTWFQLKPDAHDDIPQFGFNEQERGIVYMLVEGAYVDEMISAHPDVGDRGVRAMVYSLASCGAFELGASPHRPPTTPPPSTTVTPAQASRTLTPSTAPGTRQRGPSPSPPSRTTTPSSMPPPRMTTPSSMPPPRTMTPSSAPEARTPTTPPIAQSRTPTGAGIPRPIDRTGSSGSTRSPQNGSGSTRVSGSHAIPTVPAEPSASKSASFPAARSRTSTTPPQTGASGAFRMPSPSSSPPASRSASPSSSPVIGRSPSRTSVPPPIGTPPRRRVRRDSSAATEIEQLLAMKFPLLDQGVDHFTLLGLTPAASAGDVRSAYFTLARKLHPDRLAAIGVEDDDRAAQRLMAQVNLAFSVLNDPKKREEYASVVRRGGDAVVKAEDAKADEMAMRIMRAEEAFKQGEMALRREQLVQAIEHFKMAVELQPKEGEYHALLAWAKFAAAPEKTAIAGPTRTALVRASELNDQSPTPYFYLGRVERMLGREREALHHFQTVLAIKPNHSEAQSEARILQQRLSKR